MQCLKTYGMIVADNGSNWFISGATDPHWNDTDLDQLKTVPGSASEESTPGRSITSRRNRCGISGACSGVLSARS
jgi:hypothetical protein